MPTEPIRCRVLLRASPTEVFALLATAAGRERFWAERAPEVDGAIDFRFADGTAWRSPVLERSPGRRLALRYLRGSRATFELHPEHGGGTLLTLTETGVPPDEWAENRAGWVAVLLALKAAADFGVDLRNRDPARGWQQGYVDV
jgi:uncharacterized protein YndB with AHSA1/START domain